MRVIGFVGSPRKDGNSDALVRQVLAGAAAAGAETTIFYLNDMNIRGCQACMSCKGKGGRCRQADGMQELYDEITAADGIVIGSPVYMGYVSGQTKIFLDRLYAFYNPDLSSKLPKGKKAALVVSQGYSDGNAYSRAFEAVEHTLKSLGMEVPDRLVAAGIPDATKHEELMKKAYEIGKQLVK